MNKKNSKNCYHCNTDAYVLDGICGDCYEFIGGRPDKIESEPKVFLRFDREGATNVTTNEWDLLVKWSKTKAKTVRGQRVAIQKMLTNAILASKVEK